MHEHTKMQVLDKRYRTNTARKKLEEVVFVDEEFLHKKISKKDVYV